MLTEKQKLSVKLTLLEIEGKRNFGLCIKYKEHVRAWRILAKIVRILTFGKVDLLTRFWATFGNVVYVPRRTTKNGRLYLFGDLPITDYRILTHELVHVEQYYKMGFPKIKGGRVLGVILFELMYIFLFFPIGLAYGRYLLERKAYLAGLIAAKRSGCYTVTQQAELLQKAVRSCSTSPWYLWPWPFPRQVRRWFEHQLALEEAEQARREAQDAQP